MLIYTQNVALTCATEFLNVWGNFPAVKEAASYSLPWPHPVNGANLRTNSANKLKLGHVGFRVCRQFSTLRAMSRWLLCLSTVVYSLSHVTLALVNVDSLLQSEPRHVAFHVCLVFYSPSHVTLALMSVARLLSSIFLTFVIQVLFQTTI